MENKLLKSIITELLNERKELDSQLSNQNQNKISESIKELTQIFEEDIIPILEPCSIIFDSVCIENSYPTLRMCSFSKKDNYYQVHMVDNNIYSSNYLFKYCDGKVYEYFTRENDSDENKAIVYTNGLYHLKKMLPLFEKQVIKNIMSYNERNEELKKEISK